MRVTYQIFLSLLIMIINNSCIVNSGKREDKTIAFTNVNVIPMDTEKVLIDYTVIVKNGRILQIDKSNELQIPDNCQVVNAEGKYMIPSLSDMHIHLEGQAWNIMYPPELMYTEEEIDYTCEVVNEIIDRFEDIKLEGHVPSQVFKKR